MAILFYAIAFIAALLLGFVLVLAAYLGWVEPMRRNNK